MSPKICIPVYVSSWQRLSGLGHEVPHDAANSDRILESERSLFLEGMHLHVIELMVYETTTSCVSMGGNTAAFESGFYSSSESMGYDVTPEDVSECGCIPTQRFANGSSTPLDISMDSIASIITPKVIVLPPLLQPENISEIVRNTRTPVPRVSAPHNLHASLPDPPVYHLLRINIHGSLSGLSAVRELPTPYSPTCLQ